MGICLDTEQHNGSQERQSGQQGARVAGQARGGMPSPVATPPDGKFPMQNKSHVKFEAPKVPVIFVLGGPGSGKVTHCDNLMQEKKGVVHINMTDLLQQYAIGNDMQDFGTLSSKTVTEVLMLEMKMAPAAKTYLISGYPRSMRDVAEYSDKIQVVNGVILVSWRQKVLERQIEYGARLGHVVLSLARMELNNFYKNVMPVADFFDQSNLLIVVNGERSPGDVYKDFRTATLRILGMQDGQPGAEAGAGAGAGAGAEGAGADIPGEVPDPEPAPAKPLAAAARAMPRIDSRQQLVQADVITVRQADMEPRGYRGGSPAEGAPPALWVIGGPGSNKAALCQRAVTQLPGWIHFSVGRSLRQTADGGLAKPGSDAAVARQCLSRGDMVPHAVVMRLLREKIAAVAAAGARGLLVDGFPRDIEQAQAFEHQFQQRPQVVLLDCSKLQLGRGRLDDSVAAFRRRLELFRELSLPMLKALDADQRLTIVDGDTDTAPVQEDFSRVLLQHMQAAEGAAGGAGLEGAALDRNPIYPSAGISTISQQVQRSTVPITNGVKHMASLNGGLKNGLNGYANGVVANGAGGRALYQGAMEQMDAHI